MVGSVLGTTSLDCGLLPRSTNFYVGEQAVPVFALSIRKEVTGTFTTDEFAAGVSTTRLFWGHHSTKRLLGCFVLRRALTSNFRVYILGLCRLSLMRLLTHYELREMSTELTGVGNLS